MRNVRAELAGVRAPWERLDGPCQFFSHMAECSIRRLPSLLVLPDMAAALVSLSLALVFACSGAVLNCFHAARLCQRDDDVF